MDRMNRFYHYFNSDISFTSLLVVYLVNSRKNSPFKRVFVFFFIYMLVSKERPVRVVVGNQLFLRGREVKATVFRTAHIDFGWFADRSSPAEVGEDLMLTRSVGLIGPRSTQNSSHSWAWSAGKH